MSKSFFLIRNKWAESIPLDNIEVVNFMNPFLCFALYQILLMIFMDIVIGLSDIAFISIPCKYLSYFIFYADFNNFQVTRQYFCLYNLQL